MATGVTYEDLASLDLNSGETYTSCTFRNIEVLNTFDDNAMVSCVFENISDFRGGLLSVATGSTFDDCVMDLSTGGTFTDAGSVYTNCHINIGAREFNFHGTTYSRGSITGGSVTCATGGIGSVTFTNTELNLTIEGVNYNLTDCTSENIKFYNETVPTYTNATVTNLQVRGTTELNNIHSMNFDGGDAGDLLIKGILGNNFRIVPDSYRSCSYAVGCSVSSGGYPVSRNYRYNQLPVLSNPSTTYLYGVEGVEMPYKALLVNPSQVKAIGQSMYLLAESQSTSINRCFASDSRVSFNGGEDIQNSTFNYTYVNYGTENGKGIKARSSIITSLNPSSGNTIVRWDMRDSDWTSLNTDNVTFKGCDFRGVDFSGCTMTNCTFIDTDISGADFTGANTTGTDFSGATNNPLSYKRHQNNIPGWTTSDAVPGGSIGPLTIPNDGAAAVAVLLDSSAKFFEFDQDDLDVWVACQDAVDNSVFKIGEPGVLESLDKAALNKYYNTYINGTVSGKRYPILNRVSGSNQDPFAARYYMVVAPKNNVGTDVTISVTQASLLFTNDSDTIAMYDFLLAVTGDSSIADISTGGSSRTMSANGGTFTIDPVKGMETGTVYGTISSLWPELSGSDWTIEVAAYLDSAVSGEAALLSNISNTTGLVMRANSSERLSITARDGSSWDTSSTTSVITQGELFTASIVYDNTAKTMTFYYNGVIVGSALSVTNFREPSTDFVLGAWNFTGSITNFWPGHVKELAVSTIKRTPVAP